MQNQKYKIGWKYLFSFEYICEDRMCTPTKFKHHLNVYTFGICIWWKVIVSEMPGIAKGD